MIMHSIAVSACAKLYGADLNEIQNITYANFSWL